MTKELSKWIQTISINWSKITAYRVNFLIETITPPIMFFFIKYNLWSSIYSLQGKEIIKGYSLSQMLSYHCWSFVIMLIAIRYRSTDIASEIRLGKISTYLIYPFKFWKFHFASFISFQSLQFFVALIFLLVLTQMNLFELPILSILLKGYFLTLVISVYWFSINYLIGLLGFWLEATWSLQVIMQVTTSFLSGSIIPVDLFPEFIQKVLFYTPFPYVMYYPVKILMGENLNLMTPILILSAWTIFIAFLSSFSWKKGLKLYTAAGM